MVEVVPCGPVGQDCRRVVAVVEEGPDRGDRVTLDLGPVEGDGPVGARAYMLDPMSCHTSRLLSAFLGGRAMR